MKNLIQTTFLFFLILSTYAQNPIPNADFENWSNNNQPLGWIVRGVTASKSTEMFHGNFALKLQNNLATGHNDGHAIMWTLPPSGTEGMQPAFPISKRYTSLNGYYKFTPENGDSCQIIVFVYKHGYNNPTTQNILGVGHLCRSTASDYTHFKVPINYFNDSIVPDSASIEISAYESYNFEDNTNLNPQGNSTLYVDNLIFDDNTSINLDSALVAYYPFNGNANDESGNGNNGTVFNAVLTTDRFGNGNSAYIFNGTTSYINIPNSPELTFGDANFTLVAWINPSACNGDYGFNAIVTKHNADEGSWLFRVVADPEDINKASLNFETDYPIKRYNGNTKFLLNNWHMATVVKNGSNYNFYLDGNLDGSFTDTKTFTSSFNMQISGQGNTNTERFTGKIDDIRIYHRALSETELKSLYNGTTQIAESVKTKNINIYPNPAKSQITFELKEFLPTSLSIFNLNGKLVFKKELLSKINLIDIGYLKSGVYILKLSNAAEIVDNKLIKQ